MSLSCIDVTQTTMLESPNLEDRSVSKGTVAKNIARDSLEDLVSLMDHNADVKCTL
jgi:hypothetical protein